MEGVPNHRELPPPEPLPPGSKVPGLEPVDVNVSPSSVFALLVPWVMWTEAHSLT